MQKFKKFFLAGLALLALLAAIEVQAVGFASYRVLGHDSLTGSRSHAIRAPQDIAEQGYDAEDGTVRLLAVGDIAKCPNSPGFARLLPTVVDLFRLGSVFSGPDKQSVILASRLQAMKGSPILAIGDLVYRHGTPTEFAKCFDPIWGTLTERTLPVPGNHEYQSFGAFGYYDYWSVQAGPLGLGYYSAHVGNWLLLTLNSEVKGSDADKQLLWLDEQLAQSPNSCVLAAYHRPANSLMKRSNSETAAALFAKLQKTGASLVLNGHNHFYERTLPLDSAGRPDADQGTIGFVVGTGGTKMRSSDVGPATAKAVFGHVGLLDLTLESTRFKWRFLDAESGQVLDDGTAPCRLRV